ncbi:MAG TPA: radical SAM protein [Vicinamibacterales bacterium]
MSPTRRPIKAIIASGASKLRHARARLLKRPALIEYIAADIVNNCNLRCPFCLVDYDQVKSTNLMTEETFRALIRLAPAVPEAGFWLSCLHEPTLHPKLGDFINLIPRDQRRKFWFTTNLTRPLPDTLIDTIADSGIHHINVSFDSFNDELFAMLRKHGRLKMFRQNLDRVVDRFKRTPGAPFIRYITMAYRSNMGEIPEMVRWMNESGNAHEIEIRYTFNTANIAEEFRREQFLRPEDWTALENNLRALPYGNWVLSKPPSNYGTEDPYLPANWFENVPPTPPPHKSFKRPMQLRVRPDGRVHLSGAEHLFAVKVGELEDPIAFFADISSQPPRPEERTHASAPASG